MKKVTSSRLLKFSAIASLVIVPLSLVLLNVKAATATTLDQTIEDGTLNVAIVDGDGVVVPTPAVSFTTTEFSFSSQETTGTLGTATEIIRLDNPTSTATWTVAIAATGGGSAVWDSGSNTYPYNNATAANGQLEVDPTSGTITPFGTCDAADPSVGSATSFVSGTTSSITLMSATSGSDPYCRWDLTGVGMTQTIPAIQPVGSYSIAMTITAS